MAERPLSDHIWDSSAQIDSTGSANAYVITTAEPITGYARGMPPIRFKANFGNSGAATANINGLGAVALKKNGGASDVASGDIVSGGVYTLIHDGTNFQVLELNAAAVSITGITNAQLADMPEARVKGRAAGAGTGAPTDLSFVRTEALATRFIDITGGASITESDRGKRVAIFGGTDTLTFDDTADVGEDFYCIVSNTGTGVVTLAVSGSDNLDGGTTWALYPGGTIIAQRGSGFWDTTLISPMRATFTADGTFIKPLARNARIVDIEGWPSGAAGGRGGAGNGGGGGGGGQYKHLRLPLSALGATETVTIGAAVAGHTTSTTGPGSNGNNTTLGSHYTAFAGGGGGMTGTRGGGGGGGGGLGAGQQSTSDTGGAGGAPDGGAGGGANNAGQSRDGQGGGGGGGAGSANLAGAGGNSNEGGAGGGGGSDGAGDGGAGGNSIKGGAGGGGGTDSGTAGVGGTSQFGGDGGAGATGATNAGDGVAPGGGGGGSESGASGGGARGELRVTIS